MTSLENAATSSNTFGLLADVSLNATRPLDTRTT